MSRFYFFSWARWVSRISLCSISLAVLFASIITVVTFLFKSNFSLDAKVLEALVSIFIFWFAIMLNITILIALFRSLKYIFNICIDGYMFKLLECNSKEYIEVIGYGDLVKVFRKWLFYQIWFVSTQMVVALIVTKLFFNYENIFEWFNIYWLYSFILLSGYLSFVLIGSRCKKVRIERC